jgi:hypothetical protein
VVDDDHGLAVVVEFGAHIDARQDHGGHSETNDRLLFKNEVHAGTNLQESRWKET